MKFFIQSDKFIGMFHVPGTIQVGDSIFADSMKYMDQELTQYLGPSYAHYSVVSSEPLGAGKFKVRAISTRVLDFLEDGNVTASGTSDQIFTLSGGQIVDSQVLSNRLVITGGSGKFVDSCGIYDVQTVDSGIHVGSLDQYCREKRFLWIEIVMYTAFWLVVLLFVWFWKRSKK
jgi:hypothetical protein